MSMSVRTFHARNARAAYPEVFPLIPLFRPLGGISSDIADKAEILHIWADHFDSVLNRPSHTNEDVIDQLSQVQTNVFIDDPPTVAEVEKAIAALSSGKAPGSDAIPTNVYKAGSTQFDI